MSLNRYAARPDANQEQIVSQLRDLGYQVDIVRKPYDLVVTGRDERGAIRSLRVEVKVKGGRLSKAEKKYHAENRWPETIIIAYSADDILRWFGIYR